MWFYMLLVLGSPFGRFNIKIPYECTNSLTISNPAQNIQWQTKIETIITDKRVTLNYSFTLDRHFGALMVWFPYSSYEGKDKHTRPDNFLADRSPSMAAGHKHKHTHTLSLSLFRTTYTVTENTPVCVTMEQTHQHTNKTVAQTHADQKWGTTGLGKATWNVDQPWICDREAAGRLSRRCPPERGEEQTHMHTFQPLSSAESHSHHWL